MTTKQKNPFYQAQRVPTDEAVRAGFHSLIADLIVHPQVDDQGNESVPEFWDRSIEMKHIPVESFPWDMDFEAKVMALVYQHSVNDIPPTVNNLKSGLHIQYNMPLEEINQKLTPIAEKRAAFPDVTGLSYWLYQSLMASNLDMALDEARGILRNPYGTIQDRQNQVFQHITEAIEFEEDLTEMEYGDAIEDLIGNRMYKTWETVRAGGWVGPSLKFRGFTDILAQDGTIISRGAVPFLRWGNTTLVTAKTGRGKTTFGGYWAEYNAWVGGYDVLYLHTETPLHQIMQRSVARNRLYPKDGLESGRINPHDPNDPHSQDLGLFAAWAKSKKKVIEGKEYDSGELLYKHIAGWNVFRITNFIATFCRRAAARGTKGVLVLVDYYNNITSHSQGNTADQLGQIALTLRNGIMRENAKMARATDSRGGVHAIVFAQEGSTGDAPYGSTQILQYSQLHISIEREEAVADMPVLGSNGKQKKDKLGNLRFFHQAGGDYSGKARLRVLKANEDKRRTIDVMVENAMSRVYDVDRNGNPLINAMF